jgi:DHA2 family multidrug resistance protein
LRGFGLGFLFLSITLIAFGKLNSQNLASGIGLFNTGRQLGGLIGVAALQTLIEHNIAANVTVLAANVTAGGSAVIERLTTTTAMLTAKGMDAAAASRAATNLLGRAVTGQSTVIAFDTAFNAVALLFVIAAPVLVGIKIALAQYAKARVARSLKTSEPQPETGDARRGQSPPCQCVPSMASHRPEPGSMPHPLTCAALPSVNRGASVG